MSEMVRKRIMETVEKGEAASQEAREILSIAKKAGIDLAKEETELSNLERRLSEIREAADVPTSSQKQRRSQ